MQKQKTLFKKVLKIYIAITYSVISVSSRNFWLWKIHSFSFWTFKLWASWISKIKDLQTETSQFFHKLFVPWSCVFLVHVWVSFDTKEVWSKWKANWNRSCAVLRPLLGSFLVKSTQILWNLVYLFVLCWNANANVERSMFIIWNFIAI